MSREIAAKESLGGIVDLTMRSPVGIASGVAAPKSLKGGVLVYTSMIKNVSYVN